MYSLTDIVVQLYPFYKDTKKMDELVQASADVSVFDTQGWKTVTYETLLDDNTKARLVRTLFDLQSVYDGVGGEIMRSLEEWSNGTILFDGVSPDYQQFLEDLYLLCGFFSFPYLGLETQIYLLGSRFLVNAYAHDLPVYISVQNFFIHYSTVRLMESFAMAFYNAIQNNQTIFGDTNTRTVAEWIDLFELYEIDTFASKVDHFMRDKIDVERLSQSDRDILHHILTLYWGLRGKFIYKEIEDVIPMGAQPASKKENKTEDDYYLEILFKANKEQIKDWLSTSGEAAYWMYLTHKSANFIKKLVYILFEKVDLDDSDQTSMLLEFFMVLQELGLEGVDDLLMFDETKGGFDWNEDALVDLQPEQEPSKPTSPSADSYTVA